MPRPIQLTYTVHPTQGPQREILADALTGMTAQLPLRNLHWKSPTRTALRTIQEVAVQLTELGEIGPQREVGGSVLEGALVNLCFIACDDAEIYKNSTRSFIRDWLSLLSARRNVHAPLIILVNPPTAKDTGKNVFGRDKGILGKLKSDFNVGKRDRCVQINLPSGNVADPAAWPEVINRLKESIVSAFDAAIVEREEEVKRGEAQRMTVGWNFCTWFLLKESLAHSFEGVNLHEDALIVYEELDATFLQILKEQNLSWFGKLGATGAQDDSLPILDVRSKPYKEMLQSSSISIFDFRVYVFARQAILLGLLGRITEVAKRGQWFVASLSRRLRESEGDLAEHFIESWTYTACMDIVAKCDEWSRVDRPNGDYSGLIAYESARSELLDIARVQVERIGVAIGHIPNSYPFIASIGLATHADDVLFESSDNGLSDDGDHDDHSAPPGRSVLSNRQLVEAMSDVKRFRNLYLSMTTKAMSAYEACGKVNSVVRLKADLAALALHTEQWRTAYDLSRTLAKDCADLLIWTPVARFALESALQAHRNLGIEKDNDWTNIATAYLRVRSQGCKGIVSHSDGASEVQIVIDGLREIEEQTIVYDHKAFELVLLSNRAEWVEGSADRSCISAAITSHLEMSFKADEIRFIYEHAIAGTITYQAVRVTIDPGSNEIQLFSETSCEGVLNLSEVQIWIGQTCFSYAHLMNDSQVIARRHSNAPSASLRMPRSISLDAEPSIILRLSAGACEMKDVVVSIESMHEEMEFTVSRLSSDNTNVSVADTAIGVTALSKQNVVDLMIPYRGTPPSETAHARIAMKYNNVDSGIAMTYIEASGVFVGLPLTVNVQDFFRKESLMSHFTIASDGREYLRVKSVNLRSGEGVAVEVEQAEKSAENTVVTPEQQLSCLYKIRHVEAARSKAVDSVLRLVIEYCNIEEELEHRLEQMGERDVKRLLRKRDRRSWLPGYVKNGRIDGLPELSNTTDDILDTSEPWRTLEIPVDIPSRRLLVIARLTNLAPSTPEMIYEGRALSITLILRTSFTWAGRAAGRQRLVFDIVPNPDDWIVLGRKKGFWDAEPGKEEQQEITLIPMRAGSLHLPSITCSILSSSPAPGHSGVNATPVQYAKATEDDLLCETYLENAADVVNVLPARRVVRAMVPLVSAGGAGGAGGVMVDRRREEWGVVA